MNGVGKVVAGLQIGWDLYLFVFFFFTNNENFDFFFFLLNVRASGVEWWAYG